MHKIEVDILDWIENFKKSYGKTPTWDDIRLDDYFNGKILEAVMACHLLDITPPVDFEQAIINRPMRERYADFSGYPEWFKRFFEENVKSFIDLYLIDKFFAKSEFAYVLDDEFDSQDFFQQVVESRIFGGGFQWVIRDVAIYHEQKENAGPIDDIEKALHSNNFSHKDFDPQEYLELYLLLKLGEYIAFDVNNGKEVIKKITENQNKIALRQEVEDDFVLFDITVSGKISSHNSEILAYIDESFLEKILLPKPKVLSTVYSTIKKAVKDGIKEEIIENGVEGAGQLLNLSLGTAASGGLNVAVKAGVLGTDVILDLIDRNQFFSREIKQLCKTIEKEEISLKEALALDLRKELTPIMDKNKYDIEILFEESNFNRIYNKFISQYRNCRAILPNHLKIKFDELDKEVADTLLFMYMNKKDSYIDKLVEKS